MNNLHWLHVSYTSVTKQTIVRVNITHDHCYLYRRVSFAGVWGTVLPLSTSSEQALPSMLQLECDLPGPLPWVKKIFLTLSPLTWRDRAECGDRLEAWRSYSTRDLASTAAHARY